MRLWKALGWDTKEARTERNVTNNWHSTIRTAVIGVAAIVIVYLINN